MSKKGKSAPQVATTTTTTSVVIDTSLLSGGDRDVDIKRGFEKMAALLGTNLIKIVAMPNARAGRGYTPQSGYLAVLKPTTPMVRGLFDINSLFKGRVIVPLLDPNDESTAQALQKAGVDTSELFGLIGSRIATADMVKLLQNSIMGAYGSANKESEGPMDYRFRLRPSDSPCIVPAFSIIKRSFGFDVPVLVFEDHSNLLSVDSSPILESILDDAIKAGATVDEFFFGLAIKAYYNTQLQYRSAVVHSMRRTILAAILGEDAAALVELDRSNDIHQVTNMMHSNAAGHDVFYSGCLRASSPSGALVSTGPFGELLWVNRRSNALNKLQAANLEFAVPYKLGTTTERSLALEMVMNQLREEEATDSLVMFRDDNTRETRVARAPVKWLEVDSLSVNALGSAELAISKEAGNGNGVSADLLKGYHEGFDSQRSWNLLERCGVTREIEINEPYQPIVTVYGRSTTLDLIELSQVQLAREEREAALK